MAFTVAEVTEVTEVTEVEYRYYHSMIIVLLISSPSIRGNDVREATVPAQCLAKDQNSIYSNFLICIDLEVSIEVPVIF